MTLTAFRKLASDPLANTATAMAATISVTPANFGLSAGQATAMVDAADVLTSANADLLAAKNALLTAQNTMESARANLLDVFTSNLKLSYADPAVSDANLNSIGLNSRNTSRSDIIPQQPTDLLATPAVDGTVSLNWQPNGNKYSVVYEVQAADLDGTNWTTIAAVTRRNITVNGFAPGQIRWFRVRATKGSRASEYSLTAGIYLPAPGISFLQAA